VNAFAAAFPFTEGDPPLCSTGLLIQLGLPGSDSLAIWYARGLTDLEAPRLGVVRGPDGRTHRPARVGHIREGRCGLFQIWGLEPDTTYQVELAWRQPTPDAPNREQHRTLSARTAPTQARPFSMLAFSCYAPFAAGRDDVKQANANTLLAMQRAALRSGDARPAFALGMGDQVYVDDGAWRPFRAPAHSLLRGARGARFAYPREAADDYFDRLYRAHFSLSPFDSALAAIPSTMIWDDHELRAGWGSHGDEAAPHWREHAACARKHFLAYQLLRSARCFPQSSPFGQAARAPDAHGRWPSLHYSFDWGPQATFFVMDQRSQRAGPGGVLGAAQDQAMRAWLGQRQREPRLYVLVSPIPLTTPGWFRVDPMSWTKLRRDERGDRWWAEANRGEAHALLKRLVERFKGSQDRLLILSGDVHYSDVRELRLPHSSTVFGHEVISSGLAQSRYQTWNPFYELDEWQPAFPRLLESTSLGRHRRSGFVELHVTPTAGQAPTVRALFHLGDSSREAELSAWLGPRDAPDAPRKWQPFELCPVKHGALLDTKPRSPAAEGPVQTCKRALGADRVGAVIAHEREFISERRRARLPPDSGLPAASGTYPVERTLSGLALSGGGIRSATVCIGFMQVLQRAGQLKDFDYLSSVSGGSFANGYLQVMSSPRLRARAHDDRPPEKLLDDAFSDEAVEQLYQKSRYLARGSGLTGAYNLVRLATSFGSSLIQHWLWLGSVLLTLGYIGQAARRGVHDALVGLVALGVSTVVLRMLIAHDLRGARPLWQRNIEDALNQAESVIAIGLVLLGGPQLWTGLPRWLEHQLVEVALWVNQAPTTAPSFVICTATLAFLLPLSVCLLWRRQLMTRERLEQGLWIGVQACAGVWLASLLAGVLQTLLSEPQTESVDAAELRSAWLALVERYPRGSKLAWSASITALLTLITSPNSTSLHRYYAARVADAFLIHTRRRGAVRRKRRLSQLHELTEQPLLLRDLADARSQAPYPLFNGCVNLVGKDPEFAGDQTSDYFVFAPHHCGAKLLGFASTEQGQQYGRLSLAEAVTCSGAAISPFQGRSMPSATSILLWLLNLRTDVWLPNPGRPRSGFWAKWLDPHTLPWGPLRQLVALAGKLDTRARFVNVSDGGFIDNLGVYELLRRRCQRIVVVDATWDPHYEFEYLRNLIVRARQELKVDFVFDEQPEDAIKPRVSDGLSAKCVLRAYIKWPEGDRPDGTLYYVKAALSRERTRSASGQKVADPSRAYATYHPSFPQESTGDQFFDSVQSRAYHELGRQLAAELLQLRAWQRAQADAAE
jgi:phosphodiesterase/alkaline phosphatase D-like protein